MKAVTDSELIAVTQPNAMAVTIEAKRRWRMDLDRLIGIRQRILLSARNDNGNNFGPSLRRDETPVESLKPKELTVRSTY